MISLKLAISWVVNIKPSIIQTREQMPHLRAVRFVFYNKTVTIYAIFSNKMKF